MVSIRNIAEKTGSIFSKNPNELSGLNANQSFVSMSFVSTQGYFGKWRAEFAEHSATATMITATEEVTVESPWGRVLSQLFFNPEEFAASYLKELCSEAERRAFNSNK